MHKPNTCSEKECRKYGFRLLKEDDVRQIIQTDGINVNTMALRFGLHVRTFERRFAKQFQISPKAWIISERMRRVPLLLMEGLSNKEIAACLGYTRECNFCRDFKKQFGCAPQKFEKARRAHSARVAF
jgi:AraC-like DNA-binding protein